MTTEHVDFGGIYVDLTLPDTVDGAIAFDVVVTASGGHYIIDGAVLYHSPGALTQAVNDITNPPHGLKWSTDANFNGGGTLTELSGSWTGSRKAPYIPGWIPGSTHTFQASASARNLLPPFQNVGGVTDTFTVTLAAAPAYVRDRIPDNGAVDVPIATTIRFTPEVALAQTIVLNSIVIKIRINGGSQTTIYSTQVWHAGYTGSPGHGTTTTEDYYDFVITPPAPFNFDDVVEVTISGTDNYGNAIGTTQGPLTYSFTITSLHAPYVRSRLPDAGATNVPEDTSILLTVASALPQTVEPATIVIQLSVDSGSPVTVYTGSAFQTGYTGTATHHTSGSEDYYDFVIQPDVPFDSGVVVTVHVLAQNDEGTDITPAEFYDFTIEVVVPPPPPVVTLLPATDTLRGGRVLVVAGSMVLVDKSLDFGWLGRTIPAGWTSVLAGSGAVQATSAGMVFDSKLTAGSRARLRSTLSYLHYDIAVDVEVQAPTGATSAPVDLAELVAETASGAAARVVLRRGVGSDPALTVAYGDATGPGLTVVGGMSILDAPLGVLTLRIVRNGARIFGFVGRRDLASGVYTQSFAVLDFSSFPADAGPVTVGVNNLTVAGRVQMRASNVTVRGHMTVSDWLVTNKVDLSRHRLVGLVPPAPVEELGQRAVAIFGPFGVFTDETGFVYTLPPEKTVGAEATRTLITVQDPILRDG